MPLIVYPLSDAITADGVIVVLCVVHSRAVERAVENAVAAGWMAGGERRNPQFSAGLPRTQGGRHGGVQRSLPPVRIPALKPLPPPSIRCGLVAAS